MAIRVKVENSKTNQLTQVKDILPGVLRSINIKRKLVKLENAIKGGVGYAKKTESTIRNIT